MPLTDGERLPEKGGDLPLPVWIILCQASQATRISLACLLNSCPSLQRSQSPKSSRRASSTVSAGPGRVDLTAFDDVLRQAMRSEARKEPCNLAKFWYVALLATFNQAVHRVRKLQGITHKLHLCRGVPHSPPDLFSEPMAFVLFVSLQISRGAHKLALDVFKPLLIAILTSLFQPALVFVSGPARKSQLLCKYTN